MMRILFIAILCLTLINRGQTQSPGGVAGSVFWVKAGPSATPGTPNVSTWADQSGTSNNATQGVGVNQPSLVNSDINFNSSVNFSGSSHVLQLTTPPANLNTTVFTVGVPTVNTGWRTMFRGAVNDHPIIIETGGTRLGYYDNDNVGFKISGFTWAQNEVAVVGLEMRTGDVNFRKNGTQGASINSINLAGISLDYFGNYQGGGQNFGKIEETIIYNTASALTTTEKNKIESYLAVKYGLTIAHDYLATDGTTKTWDITANAGYNNNITGIGRDDNTGLDQRKSLSVNAGAGVTLDKGAAFGTDKSFILWGDDGATSTSTNVPTGYLTRTKRIWKVAMTGAPGTVTFSADLLALGFPNTGNAADYALLKDTDTDFSSGAAAHTTGVSLVGNVLSFTTVDFTGATFFTIAGGNIPIPGGVGGLVFWVKAGVDATPGTPNVSTWADRSGTSNNATQGVGVNQPSLVNSDINFNSSVNFSGSSHVLQLTTPPANLNTTVFTVGVPTVNTGWRTMFRGAVNDHPIIIETGGTRLGYYDNDNVGFKISGFTWAQNEVAVVGLEMRTGDVNFRKNGTQGASINSINLAGISLDYFGNYQGGGQNFGKIEETIIYNTASALTTTEKNKIESYLGVKYGLALTHDYLASDGAVIWSIATNSGYNNNITGIGRDDNSGLDQRKSLSVNAGAGVTLDKGAAFGTDKSFILWGDDAATGTSTNIPGSYSVRTKRVWKVAMTGAPGTVTFSANLLALGFPNTGNAADYALLKDTDTDFSSGAAAHTTGVSLVGNVLSFTTVDFTGATFFTIAGGNIVFPGGIPGLNVWLKANSGPEKAGGIAAGNGESIVTWKDKSGFGRDYVAVAGPTLQSSTLNFNPTVEILSGGFDAPVGSELSTDWTMFFISQKLASDDNGRVFDGHTGNNLWAHWGTYTNSIYIEGNPSNYNSGIATTTGIRNWHLHSYKRNSGTAQIEARADGTSLATFGGTNSASGIRVDIDQGTYSSGGESSDARVGEMILYNTPLTVAEVNIVESYLSVKYGLTLTHDYLATDGTTKTWDITANAGYNNNITGIGRDDNTTLDQRKSLSVNAGAAVTLDKGGAFGTDKSFILWGDDGATSTSTNVPASFTVRTKRIWKVAMTGAPGTVTFSADLLALGFPNTGNAADYALLKDTDTDFSSGAAAHTTGASLVGNVLSFTTVDFTGATFFTIAGGNIPIPGGVGGLVFWVKAGVDATPGTPNVSTWADRSGTSNNATQGVGVNQPSLVNSDINFNSSVNFSGSSHVLQLTTPPANLNTTVFTVGVPTVNTGWRTMFRGAVNDHPIIIETGGTRLGYYDNDNVGFKISGFTWAQNEVAVVGLEMRTGDVNFRKNGTQGASINSINLAGISLDYFGNYPTGGQNFGKIEETIIYNTASALTTTEKNKIESYLAVKYGLTIAHDYLATDGTTKTWDITANAGYNNNITGIGRDDNTGLDQRKSLSVNAGAGVTLDKGAAFGTDKSFILWGDDGATSTSTNVPTGYLTRTKRIWKVAMTGAPGTVTFSANLLALGFPNTGNAADYALLKDTDTDFSSGAAAHTTGVSLVGNVLSFTTVDFTGATFFTIAGGNIVLPGGIPGLNVWLKANSGPEKAGGIAAGNGESIVTWKDKSGFGRDYVAVAGPTLQSSTLNFNPTVEILSGGFDAPVGSELSTDWTMFFISQKLASDDNGRVFDGHTGNNLWAHWDLYTNSIYIEGNPSNYNSGIATTTGIRNWHLHSYKRNSGTAQIEARADGTSLATFGGTNSASGIRVDIDQGTYSSGGESSDARVGEMILYSSPLTAAEVTIVESYLGVKYGLTLTHDYFATNGTLIWNSTTNAAFHNNVTGIGRDDLTGLDQRKSLSINSNGVVTMDKGGAFGTDRSFILWGDNNGPMSSAGVVDYPSAQGVIGRIARSWKLAQTGTPGAVTVSFNLSTVPGSKTAADLRLLVDRNKNGAFGDETVGGGGIINGAVDLGGGVFEFAGVSFNDGEQISIGTVSASTPLPITLVSFNASVLETAVKLDWTTATEINNDYFSVERSFDGSEFKVIAKIGGAGNSQEVKKYSHLDNSPVLGLNYYRLKQTDFDGHSTLSKIVKVNIDALPTDNFKVYPNPAGQEFTVEGENILHSELVLTNGIGQRMMLSVTPLSGKIRVTTSNLPRGLYILTIINNGKAVYRKLILD